MKRILFLLIIFLSIHLRSSAQRRVPAELRIQLQGKTKLVDIMDVVNRYYDFGRAHIEDDPEEDDFESNDYEWWKKWEYWAKRRLNPDGTIADHRTMNWLARQNVEARFGPQLRQAEESFRNSPPLDDRVANPLANRTEIIENSYGGWFSIGPTSGGTVVGSGVNIDINGLGRMDRISFHPTDANTFYTCSPSGGVYKTTTGGSSWTDVGQGLPGGAACIEVARSDGNTIYVFSGDGDSHTPGVLVFDNGVSPISRGVFKSTNAGATWTKVTDMYGGPNDLVGHNFAISESNSNYLFAATSEGLYRTTDGGNTWTQVRTGNYFDVEFRPHNDSIVYASTATTIVYSNNGGRAGTWNASTADFSINSNRIDLAVRKNNLGEESSYVYALAGAVTAAGQYRGIFISTDGGVNYIRQSNTPNILGTNTDGSGSADQSGYDLGICVRPNDVTKIATAGCCVWRSTSVFGATMTFATTFREGNGPLTAYIHPDVHDVQYNPVDNNLYACTDGGVYRSANDGVTWTDLSSGLAGTQFYHMGMRDSDGDGDMDGIMMVGGAQDNGIKYRTSAGTWRHIICCDGFDGVINGGDDDWFAMNINNQLWQTPDGGVTMNFRNSISFFAPMAVDHDFGNTMYAGFNSLRRSTDGFQTNVTLAFDVNNFITTCPSNNTRIYGSSSGGTNLRISEDNGTSWATISGNPGWPAGNPVITDCKPWPTTSFEIYVTVAGYTDGVKVLRSTDAGANWTNYSGSLPNVPVHSCAVATEGVYIGTEIGVFFREDGAADWTPFYTGMPKVIVTDIWVNDNGLVYASTFGRGAWNAIRYSTCSPTLSVSGNLVGPHYYEAGTTVNVTATSQGGVGTDIFVKSNGYVDLLDGFEIKDGTFFKAYIGPCSTGGIPTTNRSGPANAGTIRNIIEYDNRDQAARRQQNTAYYTLVEDGIEVNLPEQATLDIEAVNTKTNEVKKLVTRERMTKGMYKILTGEGLFAVKVRLNGAAIPKL